MNNEHQTHIERLLETLTREVQQQLKEIARLKDDVQRLRQRIDALERP